MSVGNVWLVGPLLHVGLLSAAYESGDLSLNVVSGTVCVNEPLTEDLCTRRGRVPLWEGVYSCPVLPADL